MNNREVAEVFENIADLMAIKGDQFYKILAYRKGAEGIRELSQDINEIWREGDLQDIPGVGKAIAEKTDELLRTGKLKYYEDLKKEVPLTLVEVLKVPDVGPKKVNLFWKELNITTVDQLEAAGNEHVLRELPGMGSKSEEKILESISVYKRRKTDRISIGVAFPTALRFLERLRALNEVEFAESGGSLRRSRETVGDIDLIVASAKPGPVMEAFVEFPEVERIRSQGDTKTSVELLDGLGVQLWVYPPEEFGAALQYATGSQAHNVKLRELAHRKGLSLSDHGFAKEDGTVIKCASEEEVYEKLGLGWVVPELREDRGEVEAAADDSLPSLIELKSIRGELHAHTTWSDGKSSIEEMIEACQARGLKHLVITDHSQSLGIANGLSEERLKNQRKEIDKIKKKLDGKFTLLQGAEVEILADGTLDYPDDVLAELDLVIAALHTSLRQPREKVTQRVLNAVENPHVDILAHPTGRLIGEREPADLDMEEIFLAAVINDTVLEINANPRRLDLRDIHVRRALEVGCKLAINTDAHHPDHLDFRNYGIGTARRGWATKADTINTWTANRLVKWLAKRG